MPRKIFSFAHPSLTPLAPLAVATFVPALAGLALAMGCSSASNAPSDAGSDARAIEDGAATSDAYADGAPGPRDGGADAVDGAEPPPGDGACPPSALPGFAPRPFTAAPTFQGECTPAQVASYVAACGSAGSPQQCVAWIDANTGPDAGSACGSCIFPSLPDGGGTLSGANYEDPGNIVAFPNYAACLAAEDPTHGTACATALDALYDCESYACLSACHSTPQTTVACENVADQGACASYFAAQASACAYDPIYANGGVGGCYAGGADDQDPAMQFIATLICGKATDLPDAGSTQGDGPPDGSCDGPGASYPVPACFTKSCGAQIAACQADCSCQASLAACFANLFDAESCVYALSQSDAGLASAVSDCMNPLLVNYPANCN